MNTQVLFYTANFGIGQPRSLLASQIVALGPGQQVNLSFPLPQNLFNAADQRLATHVRILHPYDAKLINNEGSQLLADAYTSRMGRGFSVQFPVLNPAPTTQEITLVAMPNDLSAVINPGAQLFAPLQQITATLTFAVPSVLHGTGPAPLRRDVTIVGRDAAGNLLDGLTYVIWVDD